MNRRSFIGGLVTTVTTFTILPSATMYQRKWTKVRPEGIWVLNPQWVKAKYELGFWYHPKAMYEVNFGPPPSHHKAFEKFLPQVVDRADEANRLTIGYPARFSEAKQTALVPMYIKQS